MSSIPSQVDKNIDNIHGIIIDYSRDKLFDQLGLKRMEESYFMEGETSPQQRYAYVAKQFGSNAQHAQRLYEYASKHWVSFATPILSFGRNKRGLGISCYLNYLHDSSSGLVDTQAETNWLSMFGGGVGTHVKIRSVDDKSVGVMPHLKTYDANALAYRQGSTRRGSFAMFLDIDHPDIVEFIEMRKPTGDENTRCLNLNHGVNISDKFMQVIERCMLDEDADDSWDLIQPSTGNVAQTVSAKWLWELLLTTRMQTGEPYLHFIDASNRGLPQYQKDLGLSVNGSNLCVEIVQATDKDRTAICCLSSVNIEKYDEWKDDPQFIHDVMEMLDNVLENFINTAPETIKRAKYSAMRERSVGLGALGFHAYLQSKMIPFDCALAKSINNQIFAHMKKKVDEADYKLALERGPNPDAATAGVMKRFTYRMAVAPNASTSILMGNTSPSIEPFSANAYRQDTISGAYVNRNKFLDAYIKALGLSEKEYTKTWQTIESNRGSVQHISNNIIPDDVKQVFKTANEIDQRWIVEHAADRQQYIDQAQSLNLFFAPDVSVKYLHAVHFMAWKRELKSLYYCRSDQLRHAKVDKIKRKRIEDEVDLGDIISGDECIACT